MNDFGEKPLLSDPFVVWTPKDCLGESEGVKKNKKNQIQYLEQTKNTEAPMGLEGSGASSDLLHHLSAPRSQRTLPNGLQKCTSS